MVLLYSREHFSSLTPTPNPGSPLFSWTFLFSFSNPEPWFSFLLMNLALLSLQFWTLVLLSAHEPCSSITPALHPGSHHSIFLLQSSKSGSTLFSWPLLNSYSATDSLRFLGTVYKLSGTFPKAFPQTATSQRPTAACGAKEGLT